MAAANPNYGVVQLMQKHQDGVCSICLEDMSGITQQLPCGHKFHRQCIDVSVYFENFCFLTIMISDMDVKREWFQLHVPHVSTGRCQGKVI